MVIQEIVVVDSSITSIEFTQANVGYKAEGIEPLVSMSTLFMQGAKYKIYWDGTIYDRQVKFSDWNGLYLGNGSFLNSEIEDTGEPFVISYIANEGIIISATSIPSNFKIVRAIYDVVLSPTDVVLSLNEEFGSLPMAVSNELLDLIENEQYTVIWNGTSYLTTCYNYFGILYLGNLYCLTYAEEDNNGMPFALVVTTEASIYFALDTSATNTTVAVYRGEYSGGNDSMEKINIVFNNKTYSIDESLLSVAQSKLQQHLSTVMNGSGAMINLCGTSYNVDSTKLSTATNAFVSHLGTVAGSGYKVVINGVEHYVDSAKMAGVVSELEAVLGGLHS